MSRTAAAAALSVDSAYPVLWDSPQIKAVSYSRMRDFEECAYRALLKAKRCPEPPQPPGVENPLEKGTRVHNEAEQYIRGLGPLTSELKSFHQEFYDLHQVHMNTPERIQLEQMWCFDRDWNPLIGAKWNHPDIWLRIKQDAFVRPTPALAVSIDFKTGKRRGNNVKHNDQLRIGLLGALMRHGPEIEEFRGENWYVSIDEHQEYTYPRKKVASFFEELDERLEAVTEATRYRPNPTKETCKWCPYKKGKIDRYREGTGICQYAV